MENIMQTLQAPTILTLDNVAKYLRVHPSTIYRLLKKKQLPAFKLGRDWRFTIESIDRWRLDAERFPLKRAAEKGGVAATGE